MFKCVVVSSPIAVNGEGDHIVPVMQDAVREAPALGVYLIASYLKSAGVNCDIFDWVQSPDSTYTAVVEQLSQYDVVFFSSNSMNWGLVVGIARRLKQVEPRCKTVAGGPHATHYPQSVIKSGVFDAFFRGEVDESIVDIFICLTERGDRGNISGFALVSNNELPNIHTVSNVSSLPTINPAFEFLQHGRYKSIPVETSRGCKFQCSFCSIPSPNNWRCWDVARSADKIEHAYRHRDMTTHRVVNIIDDTFTTNHNRIYDLAKSLSESRYRNIISYDATLVDLQNEVVLESLAPFTYGLLVGAEVATKADAKKLRKAATPQLVRSAAKNLQKYGLAERAVFSFIMGLPWHSKSDCIYLADFIKDLNLEYGIRAYIQWYWPIPGSQIWRDLESAGRVNLNMLEKPGYFLTEEWFYSVRDLPETDIVNVCEKVNLMKVILNAFRKLNANADPRPAIEFAMPRIAAVESWT